MACVECLSLPFGTVLGVFTILVVNRASVKGVVQSETSIVNQPQKLLFICSQNIQRSLTAEWMYDGFTSYEVRSAGTEQSARTPMTKEHVAWADVIFVMETEHLEKLQDRFGEEPAGKKIICLNIPDIYRYMEPALIDELKTALSGHVEVPE
jgi:predicted protein tyrosine phosphatase